MEWGQAPSRTWRDRSSRRHTRRDIVPRRIPGSGSPRARSRRAPGAPRTRGRTHLHPPLSRRRTPSSSPPPPPSSRDARGGAVFVRPLKFKRFFSALLSTHPKSPMFSWHRHFPMRPDLKRLLKEKVEKGAFERTTVRWERGHPVTLVTFDREDEEVVRRTLRRGAPRGRARRRTRGGSTTPRRSYRRRARRSRGSFSGPPSTTPAKPTAWRVARAPRARTTARKAGVPGENALVPHRTRLHARAPAGGAPGRVPASVRATNGRET